MSQGAVAESNTLFSVAF